MQVEHFSRSSINCYLHSIKSFCRYTNKLPDESGENDLYNFLSYLVNDKSLSRETIRNYLQGIRFVYRNIYKKIDLIQDVPYPRKTKKLPVILSSKELVRLFNSTTSLKHKMVLEIAYSGGLRRNEIRGLKLTDIDSKNFLIRIENSKGNKDRYTLLSRKILPALRKYCSIYKPEKYLFNGRVKGLPYSEESLRRTFSQALKRSGITKEVSLHSLRHSFASHLLAMGTDLFTIQKLMGHDDIRTTMVYLQANRQVHEKQIRCPLDLLLK